MTTELKYPIEIRSAGGSCPLYGIAKTHEELYRIIQQQNTFSFRLTPLEGEDGDQPIVIYESWSSYEREGEEISKWHAEKKGYGES